MQPVSKINDGRNSIAQWLVFNNLRVIEINFKVLRKTNISNMDTCWSIHTMWSQNTTTYEVKLEIYTTN